MKFEVEKLDFKVKVGKKTPAIFRHFKCRKMNKVRILDDEEEDD